MGLQNWREGCKVGIRYAIWPARLVCGVGCLEVVSRWGAGRTSGGIRDGTVEVLRNDLERGHATGGWVLSVCIDRDDS